MTVLPDWRLAGNILSMGTLRNWLAAEPFTLTLSSGFFGFFAHAGMLQALSENGLRPARVTGTSAGSLVGAACAAGLSSGEILDVLLALRRDDFWDPGFGAGLLRGELFRQRLRDMLPAARFEDCPLPFAVSVHQWRGRLTRVIDSGDLIDAVYASCAIPLLFQPITLDGRWCADGGISDRWGLAGTTAGERVFYHHLGSRSPWRRADDPGLQIPRRSNLVALELKDMPRSGPSKLHLGAEISRRAHAATREALGTVTGAERDGYRIVAAD